MNKKRMESLYNSLPYISLFIIITAFVLGCVWIYSQNENKRQAIQNYIVFCEKFKEYQKVKLRPDAKFGNELKRIQTFQTAEVEAKAFTPKVKVLHVRRVAAAYMVMMSPAFYNKSTSSFGYSISTREKGKGADFDDITVFHLSDGTVIKANTQHNIHWLGAKEGTTVHKITYKQVVLKGNTYIADEVTKYVPLL